MSALILGVAPPIPCPPLLYKPSQSQYLTFGHSQPTKSRPLFRPQPTKLSAFSVTSSAGAGINKPLPYVVRKRATDGGYIYSGVVNKNRLKSIQPQNSLQDLAAMFELSGEGEGGVVCVSPRNFYPILLQSTLKSLGIIADYLFEKGKMAATSLVKVSLWTSLAATSVAGLPVAICAFVIFKVFNPSGANRLGQFIDKTLSGLYSGKHIENIFTYVSVDCDPNQGIEVQRWKMIGQYISLNGGVVTAEELAPYLDLKTTQNMDDESYMLPVLIRFDGQPRVDEEGNILYHFPLVHCTPPPRGTRGKGYAGRWVDRDVQIDRFLKETNWKFSKLDAKEIDFLRILLFQNLVFSAVWSSILRVDANSSLSCIFLPLIQMYDFHMWIFMIISFFKRSSIKKRNAKIDERNKAREERAKALELEDPSLRQKLLSARNMARKMSIWQLE